MAYYEDIIYEDEKIKCSLCGVYLQDENRLIEAHIKSESHRCSEVSRTLVRQSIIIISHNNFFCRVCDKKLDNSNLNSHIHSSHHVMEMKKVMNVISNDGGFIDIPEKPSENGVDLKCVLCNDYVPFSMNSVQQHFSDERHRRARAIAMQAMNGIFSVEGSSDDLWCKFCRVYFENYIEVIFEHVDDNAEHKIRISKILNIIKNQNISIDKFLMDPKEDKARCHKCDKAVSCNIDNLERHVKGKLHNK